jgi:hypothetical protein
MNKKLEQLFDLPEPDESDDAVPADSAVDFPITRETLAELDTTIDKIEQALPGVRGLDLADSELDDLAALAVSSYQDLSELGMQVDSRFASEIFSVASNMLGHAITAKNSKLDKKLKMIDLQLKKMRLDQQQQLIDQKKNDGDEVPSGTLTAHGHVLSRNELLDRLLGDRKQNSKKE